MAHPHGRGWPATVVVDGRMKRGPGRQPGALENPTGARYGGETMTSHAPHDRSSSDSTPATGGSAPASASASGVTTTGTKPPALSVSVTAVIAGAFAAVTSALVGSRLGTSGTLIGAALGSVIGAMATSLYTWSIQRTVHVLKVITPKVVGGHPDDATAGTATTSDTNASPTPEGEATAQDATDGGPPGETASTDQGDARGGLSKRARWMLGGLAAAVVAFVVSLVVITGLETATGSSLSGGQGTTIQQVANRSSDTADAQDAATATAAPTTSATSAASASATPSASASAQPATAAPSATTATTSPTSAAAASADPTTVATERAAVTAHPTTSPQASAAPTGTAG